MNSTLVRRVIVFGLITFAASRLGPRLGEALTRDDTLAWQLLPWALVAAIGIALVVWSRRAQRSS